MSWTQASKPLCTSCTTTSAIETIIEARTRDLGGFSVERLLPSARRKLVGPFIFFDHMGPVKFEPGQAVDVRQHPHINLATVTYLFEGEIIHRDSLGSVQAIRPGAINWMTAGRGIVHSERMAPELRNTGSRLHGLQLWVALPRAHEETEPDFRHYAAETLPAFERDADAARGVRSARHASWRSTDRWRASYLVELRVELTRAYRASQRGLERRPFPAHTRGDGVHSSSRSVTPSDRRATTCGDAMVYRTSHRRQRGATRSKVV